MHKNLKNNIYNKIYEHSKYCIPYTSYPHTGTYVHKPEKHDSQWTAKVCAQNSTDHNVKYFVLNTCMPNHMFTPSLSLTHTHTQTRVKIVECDSQCFTSHEFLQQGISALLQGFWVGRPTVHQVGPMG